MKTKHGRKKESRSKKHIEQKKKRPLATHNAKGATNSNTTMEVVERSSKKEHKGNALAPEADEGRDKLRKATGNRK